MGTEKEREKEIQEWRKNEEEGYDEYDVFVSVSFAWGHIALLF